MLSEPALLFGNMPSVRYGTFGCWKHGLAPLHTSMLWYSLSDLQYFFACIGCHEEDLLGSSLILEIYYVLGFTAFKSVIIASKIFSSHPLGFILSYLAHSDLRHF